MRSAFTLIELMIVIAIIAIIAAIAIPNLLESRISANEAAAATSLKSGVFPAEVQFQAGNYVDLGGPSGAGADGLGDFSATFPGMAGATGALGSQLPAVPLSLLPNSWDSSNVTPPMVSGYQFLLGANYEVAFCAGAYPSDQRTGIGRRCFAINTGGVVYSTKAQLINQWDINLGFPNTAPNVPFGASYVVPNTALFSVYRR
jgi:prepilin-type N-terminal cleavage/methylation domain-containing protein